MTGRVISIEIGYSSTRVCEVDYKAKTHRVYSCFTIPTPEDVINDGVLTASSAYIDSLKSSIAKSRMKAKKVVFTITSGRIASREVMIPPVKENRIADVVAAIASEYFPVDLSQYELAYNVLGTVDAAKGPGQHKLLVMAAPSSLLSAYYDLAKALKLELAAIDYAGNSVFQVAKDKDTQGTSLVVKIDERSTLVMAIHNSVLTFTRNVAHGVDDIAETLNPLVNGIVRVIDYYESHNNEAPATQIYITGLGADTKGLAKMLSEEINLPVDVLRQVPGWNLERSFGSEVYGEYVACVGAAAAPLGFKKEDKKKKGRGKSGNADSKNSYHSTAIACAVLILGLIIGVLLAVFPAFRLMEAKRQNAAFKAQNSRLEEIIPIYDEYIATLNAYHLVQSMYGATENRNEDLVEFLEELENKMPADVHVVSFTSNSDGVTINMNVSTKSEAAAAIEQLRTFNSLLPDSVTVNSIVEEMNGESEPVSVNFAVAAIYRDVHDQAGAEENTEE